MSANGWLNDGAHSAKDFDAHTGGVTLARLGSSLYLQVTDYVGDETLSLEVESKEILRMAHWIIKEFG